MADLVPAGRSLLAREIGPNSPFPPEMFDFAFDRFTRDWTVKSVYSAIKEKWEKYPALRTIHDWEKAYRGLVLAKVASDEELLVAIVGSQRRARLATLSWLRELEDYLIGTIQTAKGEVLGDRIDLDVIKEHGALLDKVGDMREEIEGAVKKEVLTEEFVREAFAFQYGELQGRGVSPEIIEAVSKDTVEFAARRFGIKLDGDSESRESRTAD